MQADSFDNVKKELTTFDQDILVQWREQLDHRQNSTIRSYLMEVNFHLSEEEQIESIPPNDDLTLERITLDADKGEDVDMTLLTLEKIKNKFAFPPTPCPKPARAKPKGKKKKSKPKRPPKSESTTFGPSKK